LGELSAFLADDASFADLYLENMAKRTSQKGSSPVSARSNAKNKMTLRFGREY
jgi:hypothetical protein